MGTRIFFTEKVGEALSRFFGGDLGLRVAVGVDSSVATPDFFADLDFIAGGSFCDVFVSQPSRDGRNGCINVEGCLNFDSTVLVFPFLIFVNVSS